MLEIPPPGKFFLVQTRCKGNAHSFYNLSTDPMTSFLASTASPAMSFEKSMLGVGEGWILRLFCGWLLRKLIKALKRGLGDID